MHTRLAVLIPAVLLFLAACRKNESPDPLAPITYSLTVHNEFGILEARYAVFLSDEDGAVREFRWIPANDTAHLTIPDVNSTDRFDCTVVKITTLDAPGTGVRDTTVDLTTYTNLYSGGHIYLRDPNYLQTTDLYMAFTGMTSIDSIIVPEGLTFARPQPGNNFAGQYRVLHTGRIWCRILIDGETQWRYAYFENVNSATLDTTLDATTLPLVPTPPASISLPLLAEWDYKIDRVVDVAKRQFLPIGDLIHAPGGPIPIFDQMEVFEPAGLPGAGYRLRFSGSDDSPGSYRYECDQFFPTLPQSLPTLPFDITSTTLADNRLVAVQCTGLFDLLALTRRHTGTPHLNWEVLTALPNDGLLIYRLPDVPEPLGSLFPPLKSYDFGGSVQVRAENYDQFQSYPEAVMRRLLQDDPLWQMKAGYLGRERIFE